MLSWVHSAAGKLGVQLQSVCGWVVWGLLTVQNEKKELYRRHVSGQDRNCIGNMCQVSGQELYRRHVSGLWTGTV